MPIRVEHKKIDGIEYKWCSFHEDWHTLDKFGKLSKAWDGLRSKCKDSRTGSYKRTTDYKSVEEKHKTIDGVKHKFCKGCESWHTLDKFGKEKRNKDGLSVNCRKYRRNQNIEKIGINKTCITCNTEKDLCFFTQRGTYNNGKDKYHVACNDCRFYDKIFNENLNFQICTNQEDCINFESLGLKLPKDKFNKGDHYCRDCRYGNIDDNKTYKVIEEVKVKPKVNEVTLPKSFVSKIEKMKELDIIRSKHKSLKKEYEIEKHNNPGKKKCTVCEEWKIYSDFSVDNSNSSGLDARCRICKNGGEGKRIGKPSRAIHTFVDGKEGKVCVRCEEWKAFEDDSFKKIGRYKDDSLQYDSLCRGCNNEINKEYYYSVDRKLPEEELHKRKVEKSLKTRKDIIIKNGIEGKVCSNEFHNEWVSLDNFTTNGNNYYYNGDIKYQSTCNKCRKYDRKIQKTRKRLIKEMNRNFHIEEYLQNYKRPKSKNSNKCWDHDKHYWLCFTCYPYEYLEYYKKQKEKRRTNTNFRLKSNLSKRIYSALKDNYATDNTINLLGCNIDQLWEHFEPQFEEGMTRENYGRVWHVDHIKPCSIFDLKNPREQRRCFNWRNLQPLFGSENCSKGDKYEFDIVHEIKLHFIK